MAAVQSLVAAVQRGILGVLLAMLALLGIGAARSLQTEATVGGLAGLLLTAFAILGMLFLFWEGLSEGAARAR